MRPPRDRLDAGDSTILFFQLLLASLLLLQSHRGQPVVVAPSQTVVAVLGDDVMLPCHLTPAEDAFALTLEWARPDLTPGFVHVWSNSQEHVADKQPSYGGRTSLDVSRLKAAVSAFASQQEGTVLSPVVSVLHKRGSSMVLQCEAAGWYPEPEVLWLDAEGTLLPAGPTETVRGPGDLYTVRSRLTVESSSSFTCRVQQRNISQTREAQIHIAVPSRAVKCVLALGLVGVLCAACIITRWTQGTPGNR